ncbi:hypothetical protein ACLMJK_004089 [Lecanora helva]
MENEEPGNPSSDSTRSQSIQPLDSEVVTKPQIAFISGHMDITPEQFLQHYQPRLDLALSQGHHFVIGDAKGLDGTALTYLLEQRGKYPDVHQRITVHASRPGQVRWYQDLGVGVECTPEKYDKKSPRARHLNRDARMTRASDYDILWARTELEEKALYGDKWRPRVSATELNRRRRLELA